MSKEVSKQASKEASGQDICSRKSSKHSLEEGYVRHDKRAVMAVVSF